MFNRNGIYPKPSVITATTVYQNALTVSKYANIPDKIDLRIRFLIAINNLQLFKFRFIDDNMPFLDFGNFNDGTKCCDSTLKHLMRVSELPKDWYFDEANQLQISKQIKSAFSIIGALDSTLCQSIKTIVGSFMLARFSKSHGGSISSVIGAVWLNPSLSWTDTYYAELIVHEYVHQCLFLDQMVNTIFTKSVEEMAEEPGLVKSAIRQTRRGFDKSFHSAFVAYVLTQLYKSLGDLSTAQKFYNPLMITIEELKGRQMFLTAHGQDLLTELIHLAQSENSDF